MKSRNYLLILGLIVSGVAGVFAVQETFACTGQTADGYCQNIDPADGTKETARSCKGECSGIINSRSVGWDSQVVQQPNQIIHSPEISYGSIHIAAHDYNTGDAAVGSTYYMYTIFADRSGYITMDGVRTWVEKGQPVARIPVAGLKRADGTYDKAFAALFKGGSAFRRNGYGIPESEVLAIYRQMVGAGKLQDIMNMDDFTAFGGMDGLIEMIGEDGVLELLCASGLCEDTPSSPPYSDTPLLSCHNGSHSGDTKGNVDVVNMTTNSGWQKEVWARPGDSVRFRIQYCWGAGAVGGSLGNSSSPWAIFPGGAARTFGKSVDEYWFMIKASRSEKYLFGVNEEKISGGTNSKKNYLTNPHVANIGGTGVDFSDSDVDATGDYAFTVLSPSSKGEDANRYACTIYDFTPFFVSNGYQIPGVDVGGCPAISNNGGNKSDVSNEFGIISQTIIYNRATAWQMYKRTESGTCIGQCTAEPETPSEPNVSIDIASRHNEYNTLTEKNTNKYGDEFESIEQADDAAGVWGLIHKHGGDDSTTWKKDCDSSGCGIGGWHKWVEDGCSRECDCYSWHDATGTHKSCKTCTYACYVGCPPQSGCEPYGQPGKKYFRPTYNYSTGMTDRGEKSDTAKVNVPYAYHTKTSSSIHDDDHIYLGETVSSSFTVDILPRINYNVHDGEPYATLVDGYIKAVEFVVDGDISGKISATVNYGSSGDDNAICNYFKGNFGSNFLGGCNEIWKVDGKLNPEGRYQGKNYSSGTITRVVPDLDKYPVGSKYCVAVGISTADSHINAIDNPTGDMSSPANWRISGASCRTITKKPNFQIWNGAMYTNGGVITSLTSKHLDADLGDDKNPTRLFGSWDEFYVTSAYDVDGFASGAALGYYGYSTTSLGLSGGNEPGLPECHLLQMTISNSNACRTAEAGESITRSGGSGVSLSMDAILERIYSRYTDSTASDGVHVLANGAIYVRKNGDLNTSGIAGLSNANSANLKNTSFSSGLVRQTKSNVNSESEQTTSNYASNALIIHTTGNLVIDTNICTGNGTCENNKSDLALYPRNNNWYSNIYSLPQIIIIAEGNINITENVTQIDAWIITKGNINTCTAFSVGNGSSEQCYNTLIFNGPVFAASATLNRTAGANPGSGNEDHSGKSNLEEVLYKNLKDDGSITPGEIFNLRPDALYWAFSQSQRFSQANVTYTRELAPRY